MTRSMKSTTETTESRRKTKSYFGFYPCRSVSSVSSAVRSWDFYFFLLRKTLSLRISGIRMSSDSDARIIRQHTLNPVRHGLSSIGHRHLPRMQRVSNPHPAAIMDRNPARAAGRIQQRIQDGPVGHGIAAILHAFRLAVRRRHGAAVQMIPPHHDGRFDLALLH